MMDQNIAKIEELLKHSKFKERSIKLNFLPKKVGLGYEYEKGTKLRPTLKKSLSLRYIKKAIINPTGNKESELIIHKGNRKKH